MLGQRTLKPGVIKGGIGILLVISACSVASYVPNQVIVKFREDTPQEVRDQIITQYNCSVKNQCMNADLHLLEIPDNQTCEQMIASLQGLDEVEYADYNHIFTMLFDPNDPIYPYQWNFNNDANGGVNMEKAWDIEKGDPNIIVAVLDSGVAYEDFGIYRKAPDLAETRFVTGYDFVNKDPHPNDDVGHGTHVTGTIAQSTNNGLGVAGIAFNCSVMPVKVIGNQGTGGVFDIVNGIYFAVVNDANVINMSLGSDSNSLALQQAVQYAWTHDVTVVCSAGNNYQDGNKPSFPAAYDQYCIAVGATRFDKTRAYYSNAGSYLDIAAPGGDLNVDQNHDGNPDGILQETFQDNPQAFDYYFGEGTSFAAPHVSGAAALLMSKGVEKPEKVKQAIEQSAIDIGPKGWDKEYGWGLLNVLAALKYKVAGDLTGDLTVGDKDIEILANNWLHEDPSLSNTADLNKDGIVNFIDFAILAANWGK